MIFLIIYFSPARFRMSGRNSKYFILWGCHGLHKRTNDLIYAQAADLDADGSVTRAVVLKIFESRPSDEIVLFELAQHLFASLHLKSREIQIDIQFWMSDNESLRCER